MPPSDQEPRYRLVDSNGNVVGSLWGDGNGNVKIADETDTQTTFGPDGISTPALEANNTQSKVINDEVLGSHPDFNSAQDAINFAKSNGYNTVAFESGSYDAINISKNGLTVRGLVGGRGKGVTFDGDTSGNAIDINADNVKLISVSAKTTAGAGAINDGIKVQGSNCRIVDCYVIESDRHGILIDGDASVVQRVTVESANIDNIDIRLFRGNGNIVDSCPQTTVSDKATNTVIGDNS